VTGRLRGRGRGASSSGSATRAFHHAAAASAPSSGITTMPGARLTLVPGAAHLSNVERADFVTGAMLDFLMGLEIVPSPPWGRGLG